MPPPQFLGVDFTCSPSRRKPVTVARATLDGDAVHVDRVDELPTLAAFRAVLAEPGPWLGGFDLPFGLPRAFVDAHALGATTAEVIATVHGRWPTRMSFRAAIDAWGNARPAGQRLVHRATDRAVSVGSTSPLQTRYVPVGFMYFEGVSALVDAGVTMPGLHEGDPGRIALEAYPRRLAHAILGRRSYKNGGDADRHAARCEIVDALAAGGVEAIGKLRVVADAALRRSLVDDAAGDRLDAMLCLVQAVVASRCEAHGIPREVDPVEGWIVG